MPHFPETEIPSLRRFNGQVIAQALALVAEHVLAGRPPYAGLVGSHIRHVIEHYEALLSPAVPGIVDYDRRPRDRAVERSASLARSRLAALSERLNDAAGLDLDATVSIHGQVGLAGELGFVVTSTIGRELVFVASHAVHHFALLHAHCLQHGIPTGDNFGKAPATVAHERNRDLAQVTASQPIPRKEMTCPTLLRAA
ncbi:hypothetical protein BH11PSE8_BH11PSE8_19030 [soil metagenome]